jgi:hypothetical protein
MRFYPEKQEVESRDVSREAILERRRLSRTSGKLYLVVLACVVLGVCWLYGGREWYYARLFERADRLDVVVYCDTAPLLGKAVEAFVLYDAVALSPVARFMGLYQNRPPARVGAAHIRPARVETVDAHGVWLTDVPRGPIYRVALRTPDGVYHVDAVQRRIYRNRMSISPADASRAQP